MKFRMALFFLVLTFHAYIGILSATLLPGNSNIARYLFAITDMVIVGLALTAFWRNRRYYGSIALWLFLLAALLTFIYNAHRMGITATLNGLREPAFFISSLIIIYDFFQSRVRELFVAHFTRFLLIFALLQIPVTVYQVITFGATDYVGGTFGWGGSGILTQLLFLIAFYFIVRRGSLPDGTAFDIKKVFLYSILLIPCALNETKISFIFLPLFFSLIALTSGKVYRAIPVIILSVLLGLFWEYFYSTNVQETRTVFDLQFIEKYMYSGSTNSEDMPRLARIPIMFHLMRGDIGAILLGFGYGLFGGANVLGMTQLGKSLSFLGGVKSTALHPVDPGRSPRSAGDHVRHVRLHAPGARVVLHAAAVQVVFLLFPPDDVGLQRCHSVPDLRHDGGLLHGVHFRGWRCGRCPGPGRRAR